MQLNRKLAIALLAALITSAGTLRAVEKYWLARTAQLVIVGRLTNAVEQHQQDGWLIQGTIVVTEVLYGPTGPGDKVAYKFLCSCCPKPDLATVTKQDGLWFLNQSAVKNWTSAGCCGQPGYSPIREREDIRKILRLRRAESQPR